VTDTPGTVLAGRTNLAALASLRDCPRLAARPCNEGVEIVDHERALADASRAALLNEITQIPHGSRLCFLYGYPKLSATPARRPVEAVLG